MSSHYGVLSIDPGKSSGVACLVWDGTPEKKPEIHYSEEAQPEEFASSVERGLGTWRSYDKFLVVCERFVINAQTVRNSQAPYSLEQIGVLKHLCRENDYLVDNIRFQAPVDAKRMFPNQTLKDLGVWHRGGEGHANDALRHALLGMARSGWVPDQLLYKNT
jgi:hypothetical protein